MTRDPRTAFARSALASLVTLVVFGTLPTSSRAQQTPVFDWQLGDGWAPVGSDLAEIRLSDDYIYLDGEQTRELMEYMENPVTDMEVATVAPTAEDEGWLLIFEWDPIGYVKDDGRDELDADAILESLREANDAANEERRRRGWAPLHIVGWKEAPFYERGSHNLTWATIGESQGRRIINRNVRVLGRKGVMHVTLVVSPENYDSAVPKAERLVDAFRFRDGNKYAQFVPGEDHVAEIGLAALVTGGAAAAAAKTGLLARFWKLIAAGAVAALAAVKKFFGRLAGLFGRKQESTA